MIDLTGHELGRYRVLSPLGRGGMAAVFRAFDPKVRREVALKVLPPEMAQGDSGYLGRFEREAQMIAALDHPNIVPVFDFGEAHGYTYMVMPLIAGGSLDQRIDEARRAERYLSLTQVARILTEVASALSFAHGRGLVHRDLKPSNVLIDEQGRSRLADFGIARLLASSTRLTQSGAVMGTPRYMSPEQALGKPTDARTDIYALGVMLYELLTNAVPFDADTPLAVMMKHVHDPLPLPRGLRPELPQAVERVVLQAMAKDPAHRWMDATEMARAGRRDAYRAERADSASAQREGRVGRAGHRAGPDRGNRGGTGDQAAGVPCQAFVPSSDPGASSPRPKPEASASGSCGGGYAARRGSGARAEAARRRRQLEGGVAAHTSGVACGSGAFPSHNRRSRAARVAGRRGGGGRGRGTAGDCFAGRCRKRGPAAGRSHRGRERRLSPGPLRGVGTRR